MNDTGIKRAVENLFSRIEDARDSHSFEMKPREIGRVLSVSEATVTVRGLPGVGSEELVLFPGGSKGLALNIDRDSIGVVMLDEAETVEAGDEVRRTGRIADAPAGEALLGRVIDPTGRPLDGGGELRNLDRRPLETDAPEILDRVSVNEPLQTGIMSVDALIPIGRGQRELVLGDRQTGKTAVAIDTMLNQRDQDVLCIYCAVGQRSSSLASVTATLREHGAMEYCIVVATTGDDAPGLKYIAPYAAMTIAEHFMGEGRDVLVVFDDLTRHAWAYRELSLLLRRPPAREAYPGDIFYIHSRLLERATRLREEIGGGSVTALPIVETQAQNISAYIPTNLISITDGQIYLSSVLHQKGIMPAIDVGRSVSRVGGKTQLPSYRDVVGDLKLSYSQFEELESFARFGTRLDDETRKTLDRGRRIRETLKQPQFSPIGVPEQIAILIAVTEGLFDGIDLASIARAKERISGRIKDELPEIRERIEAGEELSEEDRGRLLNAAKQAVGDLDEG